MKSRIINGFWILTKGAIISVISLVGLMIGGFIATALKISGPIMPEGFNPAAMGIYRLICGTLFYCLLGLFFSSLQQKKRVIFWLVFFFQLIAVNVLNLLEGMFFSTIISFPYGLLSGALESFLVALGVAVFFRSKNPEPACFPRFRMWFAGFRRLSFTVRISSAWIAFLMIYYSVGMMVAPLVIPYYQSASFGLKLPAIQTIILLQLGRGALILLVSLPLIALWRNHRWSFIFRFGLILFFKDVILGILAATWFPWQIRVVHGLELTIDSFLLAVVYGILLLKKKLPDEMDRRKEW